MRLPAILCLTLLLAGCAGSGGQPPQTQQVDLQRYAGTWYEQARLPMFFQRHCVSSQAQYRLRDDGRIAVTNRCLTDEGESQQATGVAWPQVEGRTDKLWVRFDNVFSRLLPGLAKGDYWVLYVDDDYQHALVGHPDRKYLWLLSREEKIDAATRQRLLEIAHARGYDTSELIWRR